MIVTCEQCTTQFQLDDAKVPERGVRVRCSRCKHAFFVKPHAEAGGGVERAVEHALDDDTAPLSSPDEDALAGSGGTLGDAVGPLDTGGVSLGNSSSGEESDWEFNHEPEPAGEDSGSRFEVDPPDLAGGTADDLLDGPDAELDAGGGGELVSGISAEMGGDIGDDVDSLLAGEDEAPGLASDAGPELGDGPLTQGLDALGGVRPDDDSFPAEAELDSAAQAPSEFDPLAADSSDGVGLDSGPLADEDSRDHAGLDRGDPDALLAPDPPQPEREPAAVAESQPAATEPGLGSPENWEFFDNDAGDAPARAMTMRIPLGRIGSAVRRPPVEVEKETSKVGVWLSRVVSGVGWSAVAILAVTGLRAGIGASGVAATESAPGLHQVSEGVELADLTHAWVDNATAGTVYVLSGMLRGSSSSQLAPGTRFEVRLLDAAGEPVGIEPAALGPPLTATELRTRRPAELRAKLATQANASAWVALAPGRSRRVQAVIPSVPERAVRFDVLAVSAPARQQAPAAEAAP